MHGDNRATTPGTEYSRRVPIHRGPTCSTQREALRSIDRAKRCEASTEGRLCRLSPGQSARALVRTTRSDCVDTPEGSTRDVRGTSSGGCCQQWGCEASACYGRSVGAIPCTPAASNPLSCAGISSHRRDESGPYNNGRSDDADQCGV